jgi:hypothetical protein
VTPDSSDANPPAESARRAFVSMGRKNQIGTIPAAVPALSASMKCYDHVSRRQDADVGDAAEAVLIDGQYARVRTAAVARPGGE